MRLIVSTHKLGGMGVKFWTVLPTLLALTLATYAPARAETCATQDGKVAPECRCPSQTKRISSGALCSVQRPEDRAAGLPSCFEQYQCRPIAAAARSPRTMMIFMDWGLATVSPSAGQIIAAIRESATPSSRITISGHTDRSEERSAQLARARAEAVREALIAAGVPGRAIVRLEAAGTRGLPVATAAGEREPRNRFVSVTIR